MYNFRKEVVQAISQQNDVCVVCPIESKREFFESIGCKVINNKDIYRNVVINADTKIGVGVILNSSYVVEHDCNIGDFCHISPNATICGTVSVGEGTWIGAGATIINNKSIHGSVVIGLGTVVLKDITKPGIYKGIKNSCL
ncbi:alpha-1,3-N-acetylgalactosamine transferase PglA [Francisella sp. W12-1067]|nr:alpha-1,3-N-acetylgalactosamine transferase PglA [Francisella sp. W12-1067]